MRTEAAKSRDVRERQEWQDTGLEMFYTSTTKRCPSDVDEEGRRTTSRKCEEWENFLQGCVWRVESGTAGEVTDSDVIRLTADEES